MAIKLRLEEVLIRFKKAHNSKYDYSLITDYKNARDKIPIICSIHGLFYQDSYNHMKGRGCQNCANQIVANNRIELARKEFIEKAIKIYDNKYDYSLINYINNYTKVKIICEDHGVFFKTPNKFLNSKEGCQECSKLNGIKKLREISYQYIDIGCLKNNPSLANSPTILYFVEFSSTSELFYKVGITTQESIKKRFSKEKIPYNIKQIRVLNTTLLDAKIKESEFLNNFRQYKYEPNFKFGGHTECFRQEIYNIMFS
jgi:hypothetical protein